MPGVTAFIFSGRFRRISITPFSLWITIVGHRVSFRVRQSGINVVHYFIFSCHICFIEERA